VFTYCDFSPKQLDVIEAPLTRINILEGAVRSGKTIASIIRWVIYVMSETSEGGRLLMLGVTGDTLYRNVISDLLDMVGPEHSRYVDHTLYLFGRTIHCVGARDVGAEKRIRGMTVEGCYIDEVTQIPQVVVKQSILRCSKGAGRAIWTTNPDSPFHWVHEDYIGNEAALTSGRVTVHHFDLDDNFALSEEYKADIRASFTGLWFQRMVKGMWVMAEGVIYDSFDLDAHGFDDVDQPAAFDWFDLTLDYGTQNPFHALLVGAKADVGWYVDEYRHCGRDTMRQLTDGEYSQALIKFLGNRLPRHIYIDPSASSMAAQLRKDGFKGITSADNDVVPGIRVVSNRLTDGKVKIHREKCPHLVKEFGSYSWDPKAIIKGEDKPLKVNDHGMDALRYREFTLYGKAPSAGFSFGSIKR
jgi:PBSX family phage terminase large subunit